MTGSFALASSDDVHTLSWRQSSSHSSFCPLSVPPFCGHAFENAVASRTPVHAIGLDGSLHLRSPVGGAAYGTPKNVCSDPAVAPRMHPPVTSTTSPPGVHAPPSIPPSSG